MGLHERRISPLLLIFLCLFFPILILLMQGAHAPYVSLVVGLGLLIYLKKYRRALGFVLFVAIILALVNGLALAHAASAREGLANLSTGQAFASNLTRDFSFIFYSLIPTIGVASIGSILILDTPPSALFSALQTLRIPRKASLALTVVLRFLPTYFKEISLIRHSLKLRGVKLSLARLEDSLAYVFMPLLLRSERIADEMTAAGLSKGIESEGERSCYQDVRLRPAEIALMVGVVAFSGYLLFTANLWWLR